MKIITFFNNKGGVGKTTTIVNLASYLQIYKQKKILLIDLDPQSNSTQAIIKEEEWENFYGSNASKKTIMDYFKPLDQGDANLAYCEIPVKSDDNCYKIDLIPGHPRLSIIDDLMSKFWSGTLSCEKGDLRKLNWLNQMRQWFGEYDYVFIDVGPSLGALNRSILLNTDYFITPMGSDIFSLLGVENISSWIDRWMSLYDNALINLQKQNQELDLQNFSKEFHINIDTKSMTRFLGYSIQQYSKRKFKDGARPSQAYDRVIRKIDEKILLYLGRYKKVNLVDSDMKLGDVPYVYSIVPLSQTAHIPIFELDFANGVRGNQISSVNEYKVFISNIADHFLNNIHE